MPVMRKPDRTKNRSTPTQPQPKAAATGPLTRPGTNGPPKAQLTWHRITPRMANARNPSSTGILAEAGAFSSTTRSSFGGTGPGGPTRWRGTGLMAVAAHGHLPLRGLPRLGKALLPTALRLLPHLPGGVAPGVQVLELLLVLERVHAAPVALVLVTDQLLLVDEPAERLFHQFLPVPHVSEDLGPEDEEAPVDPQAGLVDRAHAADHVAVERNDVAALRRPHRQEAAHLVPPQEVLDVPVQRQVRQPVAVVRQEHRLSPEVGLDGLQPLPDVGGDAGVDERDVPVVDVAVEQAELLAALGEDEVVGDALVVVEEVVLDGVGLVAQAEDEVLVPVVGVVLHDVPQDRPVADGHHRLGHQVRILADAHAHPAAEKDDLHGATSLNVRVRERVRSYSPFARGRIRMSVTSAVRGRQRAWTTAAATSSGCSSRSGRYGRFSRACRLSCSGVAVRPAKTLRTRTPSRLTSSRRLSARARRACLVAAYGPTPARAVSPADELRNTTWPRRARSNGSRPWVRTYGPRQFVRYCSSKSSAGASAKPPSR